MKAKSMRPTGCNEWIASDGNIYCEEVGCCDACGDGDENYSQNPNGVDIVPMQECDCDGITNGKIILVCDKCREKLSF